MTTLTYTPAADQLRLVEQAIGRGVVAAASALRRLADDVDALARRVATMLTAQRATALAVQAFVPRTAPNSAMAAATSANENRPRAVR